MNSPDEGTRAEVDALCRAAAGGDAAAVEALLWRHHARFAGLARRKIGVEWCGKIDAEDLLQEAYVEVFARIAGLRYTDEDSFYRWTARIIDHKFIDQIRRWRSLKRDATRETGAGEGGASAWDALIQHCCQAESPSAGLQREDAVMAVLAGLAQLSEDYRTVLQRHFLHEEPLSAIAAGMGRSEEAVRKLAARGLERLRACVGRLSLYLSRM